MWGWNYLIYISHFPLPDGFLLGSTNGNHQRNIGSPEEGTTFCFLFITVGCNFHPSPILTNLPSSSPTWDTWKPQYEPHFIPLPTDNALLLSLVPSSWPLDLKVAIASLCHWSWDYINIPPLVLLAFQHLYNGFPNQPNRSLLLNLERTLWAMSPSGVQAQASWGFLQKAYTLALRSIPMTQVPVTESLPYVL